MGRSEEGGGGGGGGGGGAMGNTELQINPVDYFFCASWAPLVKKGHQDANKEQHCFRGGGSKSGAHFEHLVDNVHHAVRGWHVGRDHLGTVDKNTVVGDGHLQIVALNSGNDLAVSQTRRVRDGRHDVVRQDFCRGVGRG